MKEGENIRKNNPLITTIKSATDGRFGLAKGELTLLQNITYFLISNYLATETIRVEEMDVLIIFDNLYFNNEIVDIHNLEEYMHTLTSREVNQIKKGNILLLNYYTTAGEYRDCRIFLNSNYNIGF